jgi:hypothetical protein
VGDLVARLVDKSMLVRERAGGYRVLETLRQFGLEELEERGEHRQARRRHAMHFASLVERSHRRCWGPDEPAAWRELTTSWANIRAAFETAEADRDYELIGRLCAGLALYSLFSGVGEVGVWARRAIESGLLEARPTEVAARGAWGIHAYWTAGDLAETAQAIAGWRPGDAGRGCAAYHLVAFMRAQALLDQPSGAAVSAAWAQAPGDDVDSRVLSRAVRAYCGLWLDAPDVDAMAWCDDALRLARRAGAPTLLSYVLVCRAQIVGERDPRAAIELTDEALAAVADLPSIGWIAVAPLGYRAAAAVKFGDDTLARAATRQLLELSSAQRFRQGARMALWAAAVCLAREGRRAPATELARRSGAHVGRSSLGLTAELDRLLGPDWRVPLGVGDHEHDQDLLDAVDLALDWLSPE